VKSKLGRTGSVARGAASSDAGSAGVSIWLVGVLVAGTQGEHEQRHDRAAVDDPKDQLLHLCSPPFRNARRGRPAERAPTGGHSSSSIGRTAPDLSLEDPPIREGVRGSSTGFRPALLATGVGRLVLVLATFATVRAANRAARVAEYSMQIGIRPLLMPSRLEDSVQKIMWGDEPWARLSAAVPSWSRSTAISTWRCRCATPARASP
jgi:hypothetical protein